MLKISFFDTKFYLLGLTLLFSSVNVSALNYSISFSGFGASNTIDSVKVQNITKGTSVTLPTGYVLELADASTAAAKLNAGIESISIYPNPIHTSSTLTFTLTKGGITQIMAYSMDGRKVLEFSGHLEEGKNSFQLGLPAGIYSIQINGNGFRYNTKVISQSLLNNPPRILLNGLITNTRMQKAKTSGSTILFYTAGDQLLYMAYSGIYSTVVTDKPTTSKIINFEFVECKDLTFRRR